MSEVPPEFAVKEILTVESVMAASSSDIPQQWDVNFDVYYDCMGAKPTKINCARRQEGSLICFREETVVPTSVVEVFKYLMNPSSTKDMNPHVHSCEVLRVFSPRAWVKLIMFEKKGAPFLSQRFLVTMNNWGLLPDGRIIIHSRSEELDDLHAALDDAAHWRAFQYFSGFLIEPLGDDGSAVTYVHKTDMSGSVPHAIANKMLVDTLHGTGARSGLFKLLNSVMGNAASVTGTTGSGLCANSSSPRVLNNTYRYHDLVCVACVLLGTVSDELRRSREQNSGQDTSSENCNEGERDHGGIVMLTESKSDRYRRRFDDNSVLLTSRDSEARLSQSETTDGLPEQFAASALTVLETVTALLSPANNEWLPWFQRDRVVCRRLEGADGDPPTMRQDTLVNASLATIFRVLLDLSNCTLTNPDAYYARILRVYGEHSWARLVRSKCDIIPVPELIANTSRYMVTMHHWRMLDDSTLLLLARSEPSDALLSEAEQAKEVSAGRMQATVHFSAFQIECRGSNGCFVSYVRRVDMGGLLMPAAVVDTVTRHHHPLALDTLAKACTHAAAETGGHGDEGGTETGDVFSFDGKSLMNNTLSDCKYERLAAIARQRLVDPSNQLWENPKRTKSIFLT